MKARLPKGYNSGVDNLQKLAMQAQKMQEEMNVLNSELEGKEYIGTSGGGAVKVTVGGNMEVKNIEIESEIVNKDELEMLSDLIIVATNDALSSAMNEKNETMERLSAGLNMPGLF